MQKLEELAEDAVLNGVHRGIYHNMVLDTEMSNYLFKKFTEEVPITEKIVHGFKEWHVTRFEVTGMVTPVLGEFIRNSNNIEILDIPLTHLEKNYGSVVLALRKLLNESSQNSLKKLSLHRNHEYRINWDHMPPLPNLQYLNVSGCKINAFEEPKIVNLFPNLRELDISNSGLNSLKSIGELKDLEVLNIQDLSITEGLEELFKLKKLRVLMMGCFEFINVKTAKRYAQFQKGLPELRFLDMSFSTITREMIDDLLDNHPKLEVLNLIGTEVQESYTPTSFETKVLTMTTIEDCCDAVHFLITRDCPRKVSNKYSFRLTRRIWALLQEDDGVSEWIITRIGYELTTIMLRNRHNKSLILDCMWVLSDVLTSDRSLMFNEDILCSIIGSLLLFDCRKLNRKCKNINFFLWLILADQLVVDRLDVRTIDEMCLRGAVSPGDIYNITRSMYHCLSRVSDGCKLALSKNYDFKFRITDAFSRATDSYEQDSTVEVMFQLSTFVREENLQLSRRHIRVMMKKIEEFSEENDDEEYRNILFSHLISMAKKMDPRVFELFFTEEHLEIFRKLLYFGNEIVVTHTVVLLIVIVKCSGKLPPEFDETDDEIQRQFIEFYYTYDEYPFIGDDVTSFFRNLKRWNEYEYPKQFADIILDYIYENEKIVGPSAKIQKLIVSE